MNHYTDKDGWNAIRCHVDWVFKAGKPPGDHPDGAYFTNLGPDTPRLATRLRIPRTKLAYVFSFTDLGDLKRLDGDRGEFIFYSPTDYVVAKSRQLDAREAGLQ